MKTGRREIVNSSERVWKVIEISDYLQPFSVSLRLFVFFWTSVTVNEDLKKLDKASFVESAIHQCNKSRMFRSLNDCSNEKVITQKQSEFWYCMLVYNILSKVPVESVLSCLIKRLYHRDSVYFTLFYFCLFFLPVIPLVRYIADITPTEKVMLTDRNWPLVSLLVFTCAAAEQPKSCTAGRVQNQQKYILKHQGNKKQSLNGKTSRHQSSHQAYTVCMQLCMRLFEIPYSSCVIGFLQVVFEVVTL